MSEEIAQTLLSFLAKISLASCLSCLGIAVYVLYQKQKNIEHYFFSMGMATLAFIAFGEYMDYESFTPEMWENIAFAGRIFLPVPWFVFSLVFARADSAAHLRKWRILAVAVAVLSFLFLGLYLRAAFGADEQAFENVRHRSAVFVLVVLTLVLANFERTLRAGEHRHRWRIKFLVIGIGSIFLFMIFNMSYLLLLPKADQDYSHLTPAVILIGSFLSAFSMLRHSLHDVEISVSRDMIHGSVIVALIGAYLLLVGGVAYGIRTYGGDFSLYLDALFVFLALVFSALLLLSTHVRRTVRMFINKHFFKSKFDYSKEWLRLTDRLSSKMDLREIASTLSVLFNEIFWINDVQIWLIDDKRDGLIQVHPGIGTEDASIRLDPDLVRFLIKRDMPFYVEELQENSIVTETGERSITFLKERRISLLVPMSIETQTVGILGLSESRYGVPFDTEDLALIHTISRQAASSFLSAQLADRIARSKELEAFHMFSTFIVHDLKNFVSMLSLTIRNMEKNFGNPEFQKDAAQSLSNITEKMKRMMTKLSALTGAMVLRKSPTDVNGLIKEVTNDMKGTIQSRIVEDYRELPSIEVDPEQMKNVIANLVMNADEATVKGGVIRLATGIQDGCLLISISDNGIGIPPEYMEKELFTLFSTTKSDGFGVGLYQVKRIVESHGGRIEVESEVERGSTFRIHLPLAEG